MNCGNIVKYRDTGAVPNPDGCAKSATAEKTEAADIIRSRFFWRDGIVDA